MRRCRRRPSSAPSRRAVAWWWLVAASRAGARRRAPRRSRSGGRASRETRTTTYRVLGDLAGIRLDLGDADVEIDGGATAVEVRRVDRSPSARPSSEQPLGRRRHAERSSRAARTRCSAPAARPTALTVPDNVPLEIETSSGIGAAVAACARRCRSAPARATIAATGFCGFSLRASSDSGDVDAPLASARPTGSSCARAAATCTRDRARRPLPDRRAERHRHDPHPRADRPPTTRRSRSRR